MKITVLFTLDQLKPRTDTLRLIVLTLDAHSCHMSTAIKHPVPDWVKPSFVIFDIQALWRSALALWLATVGCARQRVNESSCDSSNYVDNGLEWKSLTSLLFVYCHRFRQ